MIAIQLNVLDTFIQSKMFWIPIHVALTYSEAQWWVVEQILGLKENLRVMKADIVVATNRKAFNLVRHVEQLIESVHVLIKLFIASNLSLVEQVTYSDV